MKLTKRKQFALITSISFIISMIYLFGLSKPIYKAETVFALKNINNLMPQGNSFSFMNIISGNNADTQDVAILDEFISSPQMFYKIDKKYNIKSFYSSEKTDILKRVSKNSNIEEFLSLYKENVKFIYERDNSIIRLQFYHYDNENIVDILKFVLSESENFINNLNKKRANKEFIFIKEQLDIKTTELNNLEKNILDYQNLHKLIDPQIVLESDLSLINNLKAELIQTQSDINIQSSYVSKDNHVVNKLEMKKNELNKSIKSLESNLFKNSEGTQLNEEILKYSNLKNEYEFKKDVYLKGTTQLELSKIDTLKTSKFLEVISLPVQPEVAHFPKTKNFIISSIVLILIIYGIIAFIIGIIKEHQDWWIIRRKNDY